MVNAYGFVVVVVVVGLNFQRVGHISATRCPVEMGFELICSICQFSGQSYFRKLNKR